MSAQAIIMDADTTADDQLPAAAITVHHDGSSYEYSDHPPSPPILTFTVPPTLTTIGTAAFAGSPLLSLSGLLPSSVKYVGKEAFCYCADLRSLAGLPPTTQWVSARAFLGCSRLRNLSGLPPAAGVSADAFARCPLLERRARELGFGGVDEWAQDRRLIPARRTAVVTCVRRAWEAEEGTREWEGGEVPELLRRMARLPEVLVREVVMFAHSDYM